MDVIFIFFFIFSHICDTASHMLLETFCANVNQDKEKQKTEVENQADGCLREGVGLRQGGPAVTPPFHWWPCQGRSYTR